MSATINVPKIRVGSSIPMAITLTDNGVAVDWSSVEEIVVMLYFEGKKLFGGKCTHIVSGTTLNVMYSADKPQFLGVADVVVNCKYLGMEKTFDRPVVEFVATTAEATGQSQIARDPLAVDIDVEDVDTSLLDAAIHAAVAAAEAANEAASHGPMIGEDGYWYVWDAAQGEYVNTGVYAEGSGGGSDTSNCVKVIEQSFSLEQKAQARANIAAGTYDKPSTGIPASDLAAGVIPDVTGKADKVSSPTSGDFAGLDANGNLTDSGSKASDFATAAQGAKADTAIQPSLTAGLLKNDGTVDTTAYGTYSKPSEGIPSSDMASAVQTSLGKADTAYQKPQTGIPSTDLASGVIPDAVEANPTVPSGTTPTDLTGLKVGSRYYSAPRGPVGQQGNSGYQGAADELEIVNNLQQGGATSALSAEMGKEIALELGPVDLTQYTYHGYRVHYVSSGTVDFTPEEAILYDCIIFGVEEGDVAVFTQEGNYMVVDANNDRIAGAYTAGGTENTVTMPSGAAKLVLNYYNTMYHDATVSRAGNIQDQLSSMGASVGAIGDLQTAVHALDLKKMDAHVGKNLYNVAKSTHNAHLDSDGSIVADSTCDVSDFIPVEPSTNYYLSAAGDLGVGVGYQNICYYNEDFGFISSVVNSTKALTTPATCKYIRFTNYVYNNSVYSVEVQLEAGTARTSYEAYTELAGVLDDFIGFQQLKDAVKTKMGVVGKSTHIAARGTAASGSTFNTSALVTPVRINLTKNIVASFRLKGTIEAVTCGFGIDSGNFPIYCQLSFDITPTKVRVYLYTDLKDLINEFDHGLTLDQDTTVRLTETTDGSEAIYLTITTGAGDTFTGQISDWGGIGSPYVVNNGSSSIDVEISVFPRDINKRIWLFGDSYISFSDPARWPYYLVQDKLTQWLSNSLPGQSGGSGLGDLQYLLSLGFCPAMIFWTHGMNGGDDTLVGGEYVINSSQKSVIDAVIALCEQYKITPVFATIPTVPTHQRTGYNNYVKSLGYPVVDFADAVGATSAGVWNTGLLSGDGVHPTSAGAKVICARAMLDFPELGIVDD